MSTENVNHPDHYTWMSTLCGIEPIDVCRQFNFSLGNALKYILRKDKKTVGLTRREARIQDLRKAAFYINDEIQRLKNLNDNDFED